MYQERVVRELLLMVHRHVGARLEKRIVGGSARARRRGELGNRRRLRHGQLSLPWRSGRRFSSFHRQRAPADTRKLWVPRETPRMSIYRGAKFRHIYGRPLSITPTPYIYILWVLTSGKF